MCLHIKERVKRSRELFMLWDGILTKHEGGIMTVLYEAYGMVFLLVRHGGIMTLPYEV